ncbi:diphthine--ammonia ligase [Salinimicrobium sp. GXAS 041]|uniref:Dph6-related ATP pyrophosphatase n=1 Tax=Salinimicrobium sp. GXAS 041 TaxID=3400806 RepID=UPI003C744C9F
MTQSFLNWSSGKDAAFALFQVQQEKKLSVEKLVTTVNSDLDRISMHGLRKELLYQQAKSIGISLHIIPLSGNVSMSRYNEVMKRETEKLVQEGFKNSIFGDIFLEDLREYRKNQLKNTGLKPVFPLWKLDTTKLMQDFLTAGFKAITVCVNAKVLDKSFCGRVVDEAFLSNLPAGVDPCGENGEFHTFVFDGPIFKEPVKFQKGDLVERSYKPVSKDSDNNCFSNKQEAWDNKFWYCDLLAVK